MSRKTVAISILSSVVGTLIGGVGTYFFVKKSYEEYANTEIEKIRTHYALIRKDENNLVVQGILNSNKTSSDLAEEIKPNDSKAKELIERLGYQTISAKPYNKATEETKSIFDNPPESKDIGPELDGPNGSPIAETSNDDPMANYVRYSGKPYIISVEEFFEGETSWDKDTLTYYRGDNSLVDERDTLVDDVERYIGARHLNMFGVLSGDKSVVYVRNPNISTDFEIVLVEGKASVIIYGQEEPESEKIPIRRMRDSD